jgi:hypothetical protein
MYNNDSNVQSTCYAIPLICHGNIGESMELNKCCQIDNGNEAGVDDRQPSDRLATEIASSVDSSL